MPAQEIAQETPELHILVCGSPIDGLSFVGPFPSNEDAQSYGENEVSEDWWPVALVSPEGASASGNIDPRWKRFSMGHHLSGLDEEQDWVELFDALVSAEDSELEQLFEQNGLLVWVNYESVGLAELVQGIADMAMLLERTARGEAYVG